MKPLLIHNDNVLFEDSFALKKKFSSSNDIDAYITQTFIPILAQQSFDIVYIKDNLSSNYLELYGLRLAYHLRFEEKFKYVPIIILSDLDGFTLNRFDLMARILFTKNIFLEANNNATLEKYNKKNIKPLTPGEYQDNFLNLIEVEPPENSSNHSIANEWAIYRWARELNINKSEKINQIIEELSSQLYFKYLQKKHSMTDSIEEIEEEKKSKFKGKSLRRVKKAEVEDKRILYIDDEWDKGWNDIFKTIFTKEKGYKFEAIEDIRYKDKAYNDIEPNIIERIESYKPDLIILDMRLVDSDHKKLKDSKDISGLKILEAIKSEEIRNNINPAIQVIMLTASGRSDILDEANKGNKILGYIKKEHPQDIYSDTKESVTKLLRLIDEGLDKSYLKNIWNIQKKILELDILNQDKFKPMKFEINSISEILDSDMTKRYTYAMLSIFQALEEINNHYINDKTKLWHKIFKCDIKIKGQGYTKQKIEAILEKLELNSFSTDIETIAKMRKDVIHPPKNKKSETPTKTNIRTWFEMLQTILEKINESDK